MKPFIQRHPKNKVIFQYHVFFATNILVSIDSLYPESGYSSILSKMLHFVVDQTLPSCATFTMTQVSLPQICSISTSPLQNKSSSN